MKDLNHPSNQAYQVTVGRAALDVLVERQRQVAEEGWTPLHDDEHAAGEMAAAAACYALSAAGFPTVSYWPWEHGEFKTTSPRRDLVKATALLLAEIERIDRLG